MRSLTGQTAIAGIGQTEFSKESGRSELQLACEAVKAAIDDAGLRPGDVDGMVTFTMDSSDEIEIARNVGIGDLTFFSRVHHGGGAAAGTVVQAAMAVSTVTANAVPHNSHNPGTPPPDCNPVPTNHQTWGATKAIYH